MDVPTFTETRQQALKKWREYRIAAKMSSNPLYKDLRSVYNQIKSGRKVIDIFQVIQFGGVHDHNGHPKLAVCRAKEKKVYCRYDKNGSVVFRSHNNWRVLASDVQLKDCLPTFTPAISWHSGHSLEAPVPMIPPNLLPKKLTDDYYILWEVDEWKMVPPTDPWLLRRLSNRMFVVLSGWDLTPLEKAVMAQNL